MQYTRINDYSKVSALEERMAQLEQAHYSNEVYLIEARGVGDQAMIDKLINDNKSLDKQWSVLEEERARIVNLLEEQSPNEGDDNDRELRG